ncbi:MAG TPA: hypothetical protein VMT50_10235 [Steroidobacteraceae bacterium]|nr:hypothetical protein [Steroidobacteraceae bacterium]
MKNVTVAFVGLLALAGGARAEDPCDGFAWNVKAERALFAQPAKSVAAAVEPSAAPLIEMGAAYALMLADQDRVHFGAGPGKQSLPDGAHAGLAKASIAKAGRYRVSLDAPAWIDVVTGGQLVPSRAFQGRAGCNAPHKVVEFELPAGDALLQVSGSLPERVRITVTESPADTR